MALPTVPAVPATAYNDGAVPFGSRYELFMTGIIAAATHIAWFCLEFIKPGRPGVGANRPNPIGGPNGFFIVAGQESMTVKAQIGSGGEATLVLTPIPVGAFFQDSFSTGTPVTGKPSTGGTLETWVVESTSDSYEMNGYWYQDLTLKRAHGPDAATAATVA